MKPRQSVESLTNVTRNVPDLSRGPLVDIELPRTHFGATDVRMMLPVLDALYCGAGLLDRFGLVIHANPRLCDMLGLQTDQIVGRNIQEFYNDARDIAHIVDALAHSDEPRDGQFFLPRPDGSRISVVTSSRPLPPPLEQLHVVTMIDVTAQKQAETDLQEHARLIAQVSDNALEHAIELKDYSETLEKKVQQRTEELRAANLDAIYMLAEASEARDHDTGAHVRRIQRYAEALARQMGLSETESHAIGYSAILHDVGKIHVPDHVLNKPGPLDDNEMLVMREHTVIGERILSKRPFFERARRIARNHHENWDGSGYPDALAKDKIPLDARIVHVVDVFDALTSERVYKEAWSEQRALEFIEDAEGTLFEKDSARAFRSLFP